jgi:hypothetical protein
MLKFNDFEALNEKANVDLPNRVNMLVKTFTGLDPRISVDPWPEIIQKEGSTERLLGIRMYLADILFRINWKEGTSEPKSIDVWNATSKNEIMPKMTLVGGYELFKIVASSLIGLITSLAHEKRPQSIEKMPVAKVDEFNKMMMTVESEQGHVGPKIVPAPPEETDDTVQPQSEFGDEEYSVFDELRSLVIMVINNVNPSLIVTGRGGIGKTHTVMGTMKEFDLVKNEEYVVIKGASTALSMYKALYYNNGKIVIFDDCDSIFKDPDGINILKAALDSYDEREISWLSKSTYDPATQSPTDSRPVPNRFTFDGQIIFISNMPMEKVDPAVRTRSYTIDINLTEDEIFNIMEKNLANILPNVDMTLKKEVFDFMKNEYKSTEETVNVRTMIKAIKIRLSGAPNWKKLASKYA